MDRRNDVYQIFKNYFGEDKVDLQNNDILVWFPEAIVTNEYDYSTKITDVYIKITITEDGVLSGRFTMTRGSYTQAQLDCSYIHSHGKSIPSIPYEFTYCCTGSGPINGTMSKLNLSYDEDYWTLFCFELDKFVHTESVAGVPYHRLENINNNLYKLKGWSFSSFENGHCNGFYRPNSFNKDFIEYFINHNTDIKFNISNYHYSIAESPQEFISRVTTTFKSYCIENNLSIDEFINNGSVWLGYYENGAFHHIRIGVSNSSDTPIIGLTACKFKDQEIIVRLIPKNPNEQEPTYHQIMVHPNIARLIYRNILEVINYGKSKEHTNSTESFFYIV